MKPTTLHIFDSISKDRVVVKETDEFIEHEYVDPESDNDDEFRGSKRSSCTQKAPSGGAGMVIYLFGMTSAGESLSVEVSGFHPYFYVELPNQVTKENLQDSIARAGIVTSSQMKSVEITMEYKKKLFGYTGAKTFRFAKISVPSLGMFYNIRKMFLNDKAEPKFKMAGSLIQVYESNIDPMLRFFHLRNIDPCGWISVVGTPVNGVIEVDWMSVSPSTMGSNPAPLKHAFWDIECYSFDGEFPVATQGYRRVAKQLWSYTPEDVPKALKDGFEGLGPIKIPPLLRQGKPSSKIFDKPAFLADLQRVFADKDKGFDSFVRLLDKVFEAYPLAGDPIIQIGTVEWALGDHKRHVFVLGTCDKIEGAKIITCKTEAELLLRWFEWCVETGFDVFIGYNIFGFDERYVWDRLVELGIDQEDCVQALARFGNMELKEKQLSSSALGNNMLYMWTTPGRLRIDLLGHIKRKAQLPSYKLDSVCAVYLSGKLSGIVSKGDDKWLLKSKDKGDARVGRYVQVLDEFGEDLTEKMEIVELTDAGLVVYSSEQEDLALISGEAARWAVVKDDVSPQEIFRLHRGSSTDRARVAAYCIQDCELTLELYKKLDVFNEAMAMANVCSVPISYIFTRGQGIKIESLIFKNCMENGQLIKVLSGGASSDSYEGAIVLTPVPGLYAKSPIGVCDFASLYPSTIISENMSYDMLVWSKDYDNDGKLVCVSYGSVEDEKNADASVRWTDIEFDILRPDPEDSRKHPVKKKVGVRICRYAQPAGGKKGILPEIVNKLLVQRKAKRELIKKTDDPFKKALLDAEQNAYKITANSLYGQLGSPTFKIRLQDLAASVTAYGRKQIMFSKEAIEQFYGPGKDPRCDAVVVYGDTDSIFVAFNPKGADGKALVDREAIVATQELTEEVGKFITGALKAPHDFEYDKTLYPFIIFGKKRYLGNQYEESPDEYKEKSMGIVLKRRDNAPILKMIYSGAIDRILNHKDIPGAVAIVKEKVAELVQGKIKLSLLTITKSLRADYKGTPPAHKVLADRMKERDPGNAPASGERLGYVYVKAPVGQKASKLQGDRVETPDWIIKHGLVPDAEYYIEHQLMNPLAQLFGIMLEDIPGFVAPARWPEGDAKIAMREQMAVDLLFKDGLAACRNTAKKDFIKLFGTSPLGLSSPLGPKGLRVAPLDNVIVKAAAQLTPSASPAVKQKTLDNFFKATAAFTDARLAREMRLVKRGAKKTDNA